ncbi:MAG: ABC transporter permease [Actinomycetes bacterium]
MATTMWMLSTRELLHRLRRIVLAVVVVAVVFAIAVAVDGIKRTLQEEPHQLTQVLGVDGWVVGGHNRSPFTTEAVLPESAVAEIAALPGVRAVHPVVAGRATVSSPRRINTNLIGFDAGARRPDWLHLTAGRMPRSDREVVATGDLGVRPGTTIETTAGSLEVVGLTARGSYNAGAPTLFTSVAAAQRIVLDGAHLVMGIGFDGHLADPPAGTRVGTNDDTITDLHLTIASAASTIDFVALLAWFVAAGVISAITYLSVIEQTRNFAILRATGSPGRLIVGSLVIQSLTVSVSAALLSTPIAFVLRMGMPMYSMITFASMLEILVVGIVVGILASIAAARRAITIDPALAFGGV